jgi:hypothetical protein
MSRHWLTVLLVIAGCNGAAPDESARLAPGVVLLAPAELGRLERPAIAFPHDRHTSALAQEGCQACHPSDPKGQLSLRFARVGASPSRSKLVDLYHDKCMSCHTERTARRQTSGPVVCGECHRGDVAQRSARQAPRFDLALHSRHVAAEKQACDKCHHVFDEVARKRVYRKGAEEACAVCHHDSDQGSRPSLQRAAHQQCVLCHLERTRARVKSGPTTCEGCHGGKVASGLERPAVVTRLVRGQRDRLLLAAEGARAGQVSFDHLGHEKSARFCTDCHHHSLASCKTCHTIGGAAAQGGGITLDVAFHRPSSSHSCVGCHRKEAAARRECAGCHAAQRETLSERSCRTCHQGSGSPASRPAAALAALPASSEAFPDKVELKLLVAEYGPSTLPHRKIVEQLDAAVRKSRLAAAQHGSTELLCAGCHHHSPVGQRPPPCRSCHGATAVPGKDRPALQAAYHRQCMGCHVAMGLKQGCTDCHAKREANR